MKHAERQPPPTVSAVSPQGVQLPVWNSELLRKYDVPGPRYTSYPTALQFSDSFDDLAWESYLRERPPTIAPLSLYVHIPFCRDICYYCGCNKVVTRDATRSDRYLDSLAREMALLARHVDRRRRITQLHWGGGTPTFLGNAGMTRLMHELAVHFSLNDSPQREYSIEIDPRGVSVETVALLKGLGFNRLSLGIQDFDPAVQHAVNREQPYAMVEPLMAAARAHRFDSISFDLIYGLPRQSPATMDDTLEKVLRLSPDRISCYSYAHLPGQFSSQRSIDRLEVPSAEARLALLHTIIDTLVGAGYVYVGMDHFVKPGDELAKALDNGTLQRNFQGYSTQLAPELLGLGVSSISSTGDVYCQNLKTQDAWEARIAAGRLPAQRGLVLSEDDRLRRDVIMQLICTMGFDTAETGHRHNVDLMEVLRPEIERLAPLETDGLVERIGTRVNVTPVGRLLVRNICMIFDAWLDPQKQRFSRTI